ncbi:glutathione S-transferase family protein [Actinidia rufa]|uniref:Prostaglandin E synthase 2 n=1 Tax=Actinidia rufa TaxID=165716 RepID=A0A7J0DF55_9ERIC|nr:glutathione S-transferase family protein [Actinidia rufa]
MPVVESSAPSSDAGVRRALFSVAAPSRPARPVPLITGFFKRRCTAAAAFRPPSLVGFCIMKSLSTRRAPPRTASPRTMFFSAAASSLAEDVHAKEQPPSKKFLPNDVVLYQYEACPFCNKVKAFLDYHDIPYKIVEVNPMNKKEIKWSDYKKVPILMVDGEQMVDSSGNFSLTDRIIAKYAGAAAMYFVSKKLKKKYNITDERAALYEAADTWVDALKGRNFLGWSTPNLADLAVFGVLRPIRHLKSGRDIVENTHIGDWYARMESMVGVSSRIMA